MTGTQHQVGLSDEQFVLATISPELNPSCFVSAKMRSLWGHLDLDTANSTLKGDVIMARENSKSDGLPAELLPIVRRSIEESIEEASTQIGMRIKTGLALMAEGSKLTNSNIESMLAAARIATDSWTKLAESTARSCQRAFAGGFEVSRSISAATEALDSRIKSGAGAEKSVSSALAEQVAMFNKTSLKIAQDMARQLIEPLVFPATAGMPNENSSREGREPIHDGRDRGGSAKAEAHA
jgi:hypothetical protein